MVRPTSDFAREAIFNILTHSRLGLERHAFIGQDVLDLFCGTGALGLEALSRGARRVTFLDKSREALANAHYNASKMQEEAQVDFLLADATRLPAARRAYGLVFVDPPYFRNLLEPALQGLDAQGWLAPDALVVAEHGAKERIPVPAAYERLDERQYGRAVIHLLKRTTAA